jgi:AcrR family transcriptional regulator
MTILSREAILDSAVELISQRGVRGFSATELARRLGVVKSALYHYFTRGKAGIVDAVFSREEEKLLANMRATGDGARGARARLTAVAVAKVRQLTDLARLYRVREEIAEEVEGFLVARRRGYLARERRIIAEVIESGVASGEVRAVDAEVLATALQGALQQLSLEFAKARESGGEEVVGALVTALFEGIGGKR